MSQETPEEILTRKRREARLRYEAYSASEHGKAKIKANYERGKAERAQLRAEANRGLA